MAALAPELRSLLDKAVVRAREEAERAAEAALRTLAVDRGEPFATHSEAQKRLRNLLRAKVRQLSNGGDGFKLLTEEVAYEQWHRMLFARFLAENQLLMHPGGIPVTLQECSEIASEEGEQDGWTLAARFAGQMLPGIFRLDDPSIQVTLAREGRAALEDIVGDLPPAIFTSDDGLGWVYQFWQSKRKKEVSSGGRKIAGLDLAAYSQLFTEDYMVRFLLENSLGAWWAGQHPESALLKEFTYLRRLDDGTPAAGAFPGWPVTASQVTLMDPCCGSGHFLVAAFEMLRRMRMEEEGLDEREAADAVLRDNLFGLEIDPRCVQIAAFALALAAWKCGGYRQLPVPNLACSGIPLSGRVEEWTKLAGDDVNLRHSLESLHHLFRNAPDLGSLINPADVPTQDRMFTPDFATVGPMLERALAADRGERDPVAAVFGEFARGVARAAELLVRSYTIVATNVPYLGSRDQGEVLRRFSHSRFPEAERDLATVFLLRCLSLARGRGSVALVNPQYWLGQVSYEGFRRQLLQRCTLDHLARLGTRAFRTISGEKVNVSLAVFTTDSPTSEHMVTGIDVSASKTPDEKDKALRTGVLQTVAQHDLLESRDSRISLEAMHGGTLLSAYASSLQGTTSGDNPRYIRFHWEIPLPRTGWEFLQTTVSETIPYGGRETILYWENGQGSLTTSPQARVQGQPAFGRRGVSVKQMGTLPCTIYDGNIFDMNCAAILPRESSLLAPIWAFCSSSEFGASVRRLDPGLKVTNATLVQVPFDLERWRKVAEEQYPSGLPEPYSNDPTQWLFRGNPVDSVEPLQVSVCRLLGYRWPEQPEDGLGWFADKDGLLPLSAIPGEEPAAERLRSVLNAVYGSEWSPAVQEQLLQDAGFGGRGLDAWLRDGFSDQHTKLFQQRPFIWHIWDGRRDGFSILANYHLLDSPRLDKLIYTYLGEWIRIQRADRDAGTAGADARLVAALELQQKLEAIRDGEPPFDIYVRWKPLAEQPLGWNPDLDDGVRLNIRPFVEAGVLRSRVNVKWGTDRGLNPDGSARINDRHCTIAEKRAARETGPK